MSSFEILVDKPMSSRGERFIRRFADAAPKGVRASLRQHYKGDSHILVLYGPGSAQHLPLVRSHVRAGGRAVLWDMGYWDRETSMRLAVDTLHPTPEQLMLSADRPARRKFTLREDADPDGPILLIGLGIKSVSAYGKEAPLAWETQRLHKIKQDYPGVKVLWRPKGTTPVELPGTSLRHGCSIEDALRGCRLAVVHHSNVAVDACVAGVPVECEAGAALALYGHGPDPSRESRLEFLRRLTWWEWGLHELPAAWEWVRFIIATQSPPAKDPWEASQ